MVKVVTDATAAVDGKAKPADVAFCVDAYEYPGKGQKPKAGVSAGAAAGMCKKDGKRLCSSAEWTHACGETEPAAGACNVSGSMKETGASPACKTAEGIFDLVGNAGEWTTDGRLHGGDASTGKGSACGYSTKHFMPKGMDGFRCCADATR
jgi:formylglycine-generating enzyme required for sulfatase activity